MLLITLYNLHELLIQNQYFLIMYPNVSNRSKKKYEVECLRSSGCLDTASYKPYMFALIVNDEMKIANIAYKIIRKYMLIVQTIFTIKCQTGEFSEVSVVDPIHMKKKKKSQRLFVILPVPEREIFIIMCACVLG